MSQQKLDSRRQQNTAVCSKNKPLAPRDGSGGRAGSTGSTKSESPREPLILIFKFIYVIYTHKKLIATLAAAASPALLLFMVAGGAWRNEMNAL